MKNLSKLRRSNMLSYLNQLKEKDIENNSSIIIKEIEQEITNKKYGLVWEEHYEKIDLDMTGGTGNDIKYMSLSMKVARPLTIISFNNGKVYVMRY